MKETVYSDNECPNLAGASVTKIDGLAALGRSGIQKSWFENDRAP